MPTIKERLQKDWIAAMKAKDKVKANSLSTFKSAVLLVEKTNNVKLDDEQVIEILSKEVKQRKESVIEFQKGTRQDLVDATNAEIELLLEYLPQQLSEEEIKNIVKSAADSIGANGMKDMGKVMAALKPQLVGRADGRLVSQIVKEYLNK